MLTKYNCLNEVTNRRNHGNQVLPEADLATAVPEPIATPISAFFKAGASLTPSPVMAVISPTPCRYSTILLLWLGSTLENSLQGQL